MSPLAKIILAILIIGVPLGIYDMYLSPLAQVIRNLKNISKKDKIK
jgi:uncharacterized membrane protein YccF (DUF307 family)